MILNLGEDVDIMVKALSFIIACVLTFLMVIILYPVAGFFWLIGKIGKIVDLVSDWIFEHANITIKNLWSDLKSNS